MMTNDDASNRVDSIINSTSGYYPSVKKNDVDYRNFIGKLTKDWLHCFLVDTTTLERN